MARTVAGIWWPPTMEGTPALVVSAAFFGLGGVAGCFLALQSASDGVAAMHDYLDRFLAAAQAGAFDLPGISETLWRSFRWPLAAVLLGFTAMGFLGIPLLASMRGFFLSFSIASFAYAYGRKGLLMAFFLLGIPGLLALPAFLLLAAQGFAASSALASGGGQGRRENPYRRDYFLRCGFCIALTGLSALSESYLLPVIMARVAGALL